MNAPLTLHRDPMQSSAMSAPIWRRIPDELMTEDEVQAEIDTYRTEKRAKRGTPS